MNKELEKFSGINIALNACYDADGNVDTEAYRKLCSFYASKGVKGLYVCGSTGEGLLMKTEERKRVLETVADAAQGKLTVIAHVGALATRDSVELAKHAESVGVDAISSLPCIYYAVTDEAIEKHWKAIIDSTDLPFIIYNIPDTTHYNLSPELCRKMAQYNHVIGIKNSSMSSYDINRYKRIGGKNFIVFNGPDEQYIAGRISGAAAGIGGSYGVMPEFFIKIEEYIQETNIAQAQNVQNHINYVIEEMYASGSFVGAAKHIISRRITDIGPPRMPILPLREDKKDNMNKLVEFIEETIPLL